MPSEVAAGAMGLGVTPGRLYGVGVGPGDPDLMTVKARRLIEQSPVLAYPIAASPSAKGVARTIAEPFFTDAHTLVPMVYPVTTGHTDHPGGYEGALADFYDASAAELATHLDAGRDVVVLCEGDPFFYGSYMYLHERLAHRYVTEVVPGVTAFSGAAAAAGLPLVKRDDVLVVAPGTLPEDELRAHLQMADAAVLMKLGRTFPGVRDALEATGMAGRAVYVERATSPAQRVEEFRAVEAEKVPYMSIVLTPGTDQGCDAPAQLGGGAATGAGDDADGRLLVPGEGKVTVVGLGPGGAETLTPEAHAALAEATDVIGYDTYLARVPERRGQRRHGSDNRVELDRSRHALELAAAGARVAVVSSGDPGIFAMATAVLEALDAAEGPARDVEVEVLPGISAVQAVAARVGAPAGHDLAMISLSDIRKPWDVIERRLRATSAGDLVLALYNPASKTRREQLERAVRVLREDRDPSTPVVIARAVRSGDESVTVTTLGELDPAVVDMRTLLLVGSTQTRVLERPGHAPLVWTSRDYPTGDDAPALPALDSIATSRA
ncbi:MAG: precorrin-2 C(20)-methyltransferase [Solirubrobacteraceae bacterium]|nr:precorrin-2 C(20)-methyltransferase [Solirubrobacteraceae bacterium]